MYIYIKWNYIVSEKNSYKKKYGVGGTVVQWGVVTDHTGWR